ncbi:MAG: phosphatidate cytidylyltransferase [Bacteroidales bacterium]|nr:phosphatidate cytidylyltransferase [Bacteroidales bacterium]
MDFRKLATRIGGGILFLVVVVGCTLFPWGFLALSCLVSCGLSVEFYRMTVERRFFKEEACVILAIVAAVILLFFHFQCGIELKWMLLALLPVVAASVFLLFDGAKEHDFPTAVYFPLVYILPGMLSALAVLYPGGGNFEWRLLLGIMVLLWLNDIGAYVVGMSFGQRPDSRKLFPALSPKKSWIGVAGGTVFTFLAAWAVSATFGGTVLPLLHWMALALIVSVFGVMGDLFESLIKRHASVKDAGNLIPGHGGLLDRFDDVVFVLPVIVVYLKLLSLI